ncbi:CocE/NonD family hydrolase [Rhodobacteraceae bacterium D3-12]|nr:CocE/NonD family hydrolase [Rhodobacteraceae bacterium D3-12]
MTAQRFTFLTLFVLVMVISAFFWPVDTIVRSLRDKLAWQVQAGTPSLPDIMIPMPDGIRLATDVYLPDAASPAPTVLLRLPYGKRSYGEVRFWVHELTKSGFVVVAQDMRGRHNSQGVFTPYPNAGSDGYATLDWIVSQPWSNGRVGTLGCSALGEAQLMLAARMHPAHRAMVPIAAGGAIGTAGGRNAYFSAFEGGILNLSLAAGWFGTHGGKTPETSGYRPLDPKSLNVLPVIDVVRHTRPDLTDYDPFLRQFSDASYWKNLGYITGHEPFRTPALFIDTWHDPGVSSTLELAKTFRNAGAPVSTIIAAGTHCGYLGTDQSTMVGDLPINPETTFGFVETIIRFLKHHLADGPAATLPYLSFYGLIEDRWNTSADWPPATAIKQRYLLTRSGTLVKNADQIKVTKRRFTSDPSNPVPSIGGAVCCTGDPEERSGPVFQNAIETRHDVLLFTSAPLAKPLRIAGPINAKLRVSITTPDTDLVLRLIDVDPDGQALLVQEGALRLRYRNSFDEPSLLKPGEVYEITVSLRDIAYQFNRGHQLRLHVAGTSFPRLERNLNTGRVNFLETNPRSVEITLHSTPEAPSALELYVLSD